MDKYQRVLLENGNKEEFFSCTPIKKRPVALDSNLAELNFPSTVLNFLQRANIISLERLISYSRDDLQKFRGITEADIIEIENGLLAIGFSLKNTKSNFDYDKDCYILTQEEDIFSTQYQFTFKANSNIENCCFFVDGEWHSANKLESCFFAVLDFNHRIEKIRLTFADNIVDDYTFSIQYVEADKDLYYKKQEENRKANLLAAAQIKHSTSSDLINIYFQPCCDKYEYTEILLYIPQEENFKGWTGDGRKVVEILSWSMIKKCKVPSEDFYKSINGLAPGTYSYVIKQYDKKDELLMETEHFEFRIQKPKQPIMGRINRI